ncbi:FxDxF family PEP-CTERM protein [Sphaerotilus microaerophilus]|uniref:Ice-binding protein C-terminal domain-containing protein n=1 Tax=Sphaerotilus microaerophilus TaxID=2914710 RepID=A0ABN6PLM1_9BURK|nr:FxDxF family PEP-CTERM protein [Sphaerotilus sp. FB-5]BDI04948.1 hypothetical protein CATMQ487_19180 [Sphaerotilus sp. FB-5]
MNFRNALAAAGLALASITSFAAPAPEWNAGTTNVDGWFSGYESANFGFNVTGATTASSLVVSGFDDLASVALYSDLGGLVGYFTQTLNGPTFDKFEFGGALAADHYAIVVLKNAGWGGYSGSLHFNPGTLDTSSLTATPVPEPETYAMMMAGLGAIGFLSRRRSKAA